jgi:hypothetical protein
VAVFVIVSKCRLKVICNVGRMSCSYFNSLAEALGRKLDCSTNKYIHVELLSELRISNTGNYQNYFWMSDVNLELLHLWLLR